MSRLVVIGAGDVGGRVAARWVALGHGEAVGITATPTRHEALARAGVEPRTGEARTHLRRGDRVLLAASGSPTQEKLAASLPPLVGRAVMTSSTGFYQGRSGLLGASTPAGDGRRALAAAQAETAFRANASDPVVVRLGGLYRRGRGPQEALRRRGHALVGPAARPLPLIHIDDVVTALLAALTADAPAPTYVGVVLPAPSRRAYYDLACTLLDLPAPTFEGEAAPRSFIADRFRAELLPDPAWPSWREGLEHALR